MAKVVKLCSMQDCSRKHAALGFCSKHYKMKKNGKRLVETWDIDEFWEFVKKELDIAI